ncbi:DegT/DnrJ/EryC1/StrS family aminotransferase [Paenibacillus mendelii]|uniref:DegT/DnrJ/EryC1/StrS family aminotransferase n=1 Tax=Paenibacillus mendelii TaxID=206163 RepID=A0ABV6JJ47_9BACL|nr:DegT/DnrJ/EryC1/StrS family aminotransferase [Paenibacillus mendelii]MCQ6557744.1 DegT/DnrJ/EryC1/StrS family aminotransferase [Paenibacillus mendelii]
MNKLAIDGGTPARSVPLPPNYPGATVMGVEEADRAGITLKAQSPFRYYGPHPQNAVRQLEELMARDLGVPYTLGVSSCTAALVVALKALGIGYGDKVIVPANTFLATPGAVVASHAVPVFVDVDDTLNMNPDDLERIMDDEVKAIITVPILGSPVDLDPILAFAKQRGIAVIEDVAQSLGTTYKGRYAGTLGDIGVYSFQMNKILTAGEGGAVVTSDPVLFDRAVRYHDQGIFRDKDRYGMESPEETHAFLGQNYRMSDLSGAVLVEQWNKLEGVITRMRERCRAIRSMLSAELPDLRFRRSSDPDGDIGSNLGMFLPSAAVAERFIQALNAENIGTYLLYGGRPVYMLPQIFHQKTVDKTGFPFDYPFRNPVVYTADMCPTAVDLMPRTVYLPVSPVLTDQDVTEIVDGIVKVWKSINSVMNRAD